MRQPERPSENAGTVDSVVRYLKGDTLLRSADRMWDASSMDIVLIERAVLAFSAYQAISGIIERNDHKTQIALAALVVAVGIDLNRINLKEYARSLREIALKN